MRTILAVAVLALCASGLTAQDDKKYEKEGRFTAKFPNGPEQSSKSAGGLTLRIFLADFDKGKGAFMVTYSDLPADVLKAPKPEQVLESSQKGLQENFKAEITKSEATKVGPKMYPGRSITAKREETYIRGSIVLVGARLYQVYVIGSKAFTESKEAGDFLASFEITG